MMKVKAVFLSTTLALLLSTPAFAQECMTRLDALGAEFEKSDVEYWLMAKPPSRGIRVTLIDND